MMNRNFQISKETLDRVKLAKKYIENRYQTIIEEQTKNKENWKKIISSINLTNESFDEISQRIIHKQTINKRLQRQKDNLDNYQLFNIIGRGAFGEVRLAKNIATNQIVAIKRLQKKRLLQKKQIYNAYLERDFMVGTNNSSLLVQMKSAFQDDQYLYIAMEYVPGGDLLHLLIQKDTLSQEQTKFYVAEMILAVQQIHQMNYIHRDIKPDNVLLDKNGHVKISDFGLSKYLECRHPNENGLKLAKMQKVKKLNRLKARQKIFSKVGTPDYISPEVLTDDTYDHSIDIWGVGVIMFECLFGYPPFTDDDSKQVCHRVINWVNYLQFPSDIEVSTAAKMLILGMVNQRSKRLNLKQIKKHPFFQGVNWDNIHKNRAPNIPKLKNELDVGNFDEFQIKQPWQKKEHTEGRNTFVQQGRTSFKFPGFQFKKIEEDPFVTTIKSLQKIQSSKTLSKQKKKNFSKKRLRTQQCQRKSEGDKSSKQKHGYLFKKSDRQSTKYKNNVFNFRQSVKQSYRSPDKENSIFEYGSTTTNIHSIKLKPFKKMAKNKIQKVKQAYGTKSSKLLRFEKNK